MGRITLKIKASGKLDYKQRQKEKVVDIKTGRITEKETIKPNIIGFVKQDNKLSIM